MRRFSLLGIVVALVVMAPLAALANGAGGVTGPGFYVDGVQYRTVGTPTDLSGTGGPDHSFDTIYAIGNGQENVATAAPGDRGFNGGRWRVTAIDFAVGGYESAIADPDVDLNDNDILDSAAEVQAAVDAGYAEFGAIVRSFECPVIKVPAGRN